jgi:hypothetical protein
MDIFIKVLILNHLNYFSFNPLSRFPAKAGQAPQGGKGFIQCSFPLGEGRVGGNDNKKVRLSYY